jgi:glycerol-3-phosphate dehydrogenase
MKRDVNQLSARTFDVLVVGGGIYGLTIAHDAALRGLSVALVEGHDFGSGASFNHLRTIHGGLRYLQTLDIARARESVRERRTLATIAPAAVRPLRFILPAAPSSLTRGTTAMRIGFALDQLVAFDRNRGVPASHRLPPGRVDASGSAVWYDYVTTEADRLTFSFADAASRNGAVLANYVEAVAPHVEHRRVVGVRATDGTSGREVEISARVTVNATASSVDRLLEPLGVSTRTPLLKAMNLVTSRPAGDAAIGGRARSGRHLFLVPWRGRALFGTWESARQADTGDTSLTADECRGFLEDLNEAFPSMRLTPADVTLVHRGLVPAAIDRDGRVSLQSRELVRDHARDGVDGIVSVVGTKYTTARAVAERVTDRIVGKLERRSIPCRTATTALPVREGEIAYAARHEMVVKLSDAVMRRTPLGALGYPGDTAIQEAANVVGAELEWSEERKISEIDAVRAFYAIVPSA